MKENNIKVSVVIPVYNVGKYLPKCLDTVLAQSYKNLEILVVDDGATDNSGVICDQYAQQDKRIKVFHKKNGGLSDARNYALDYVTGDYIAFIDSDDYIDDRYIEVLLSNALGSGADISICDYKIVEEDAPAPSDYNRSNAIRIYNKEESMLQILHGDYIMQFSVAWCKLYKREIFNKIRYPFGRKFEDVAVAHLCYSLSNKAVYSNSQLYFYLQRAGSIKNSGRFKDTDVVKSAWDRLMFFEKYEDGKYLTECKKQYMTAIMGTYVRFAETTEHLKQQKNELLMNAKEFVNKNKKDIFGFNMFSARCMFFLAFPYLYSKLVLAVK